MGSQATGRLGVFVFAGHRLFLRLIAKAGRWS
jgi:hypothetical protein